VEKFMIRSHLLILGAAFITTLAIAPEASAAARVDIGVAANGAGVAKTNEIASKEFAARFKKDGRDSGLTVRKLSETGEGEKTVTIRIVITGFDKDGDGDADRFKLHLELQDDDDDDVDFSDDEADDHDAADDAEAERDLLADVDKMVDKTEAYMERHHE
jgi:hypothetical protein